MPAAGVLEGVLGCVTGENTVKYATFLGNNGHTLRDTSRVT